METTPFDLLPDEMVMKIIKMAIGTLPDPTKKHEFIAKVIAKLSSRFRGLAMDRSLWRGEVTVEGSDEELTETMDVLSRFPVTITSITKLSLERRWGKSLWRKWGTLDGNLFGLAAKCSKLEELTCWTRTWNQWPCASMTLTQRLTSLRRLTINIDTGAVTDAKGRSTLSSTLQRCVPNLRFLHIKKSGAWCPLRLPDMTGCKKLEVVKLEGGPNSFSDETHLWIPQKMPLPRSLKKLYGYENIHNWDTATSARAEEYFDDCVMLRLDKAE